MDAGTVGPLLFTASTFCSSGEENGGLEPYGSSSRLDGEYLNNTEEMDGDETSEKVDEPHEPEKENEKTDGKPSKKRGLE